MKNIITTKLTQEKRDKIDSLFDQIDAELDGVTVGLDEEERVKYGSVNEQNKLLVNKTRDLRQNSPNMSSPDVDWDEFEEDYQARQFYDTRGQRAASIAYRMQSTKILHDYDNYQDSLSDYAYAQYKKGTGEPGYAEKVAEMKQFFNRTGKSKQTQAETDTGEENNNE